MVVTEDMFKEWLEHPVTKNLFSKLKVERHDMVEGVIYDKFFETSEIMGRVKTIDLLLNIEYEDIQNG
jgi:hypothetical protein